MRIISYLKTRTSQFSQWFHQFSEPFFRTLFTAIFSIIFAKAYGPEVVGKFAALSIVIAVMTRLGDLGLARLTLVLPSNQQFNLHYHIKLLTLRLISSLLAFLPSYFFAFFITESVNQSLIVATIVFFLLILMHDTSRQAFVDSGHIKVYARASFAGVILLFGARMLIVASDQSWIYLIPLGLVEPIILTSFCVWFVRRRILSLSVASITENLFGSYRAFFKIIKLSSPLYLAGLNGIVLSYSDSLMIKIFSTFKELGFYSFSLQFSGACIMLLPSISSYYASKLDNQIVNKKYTLVLYAFSFLGSLSAFLFILLVNKFLLNTEYNHSVLLCLCLVPVNLLLFSSQGLSVRLQKHGLGKIIVSTSIVTLLANLTLNSAFIPDFGALGAIMATVMSIIIGIIFPLLLPFRKSIKNDYNSLLNISLLPQFR